MRLRSPSDTNRSGNRRLIAVVLAVAGMFGTVLGSRAAFAHAFPVREVPGPGAVLTVAPQAVVISFTESVNARFSGITVRAVHGASVDDGMSKRDRRDRHDHKVLTVRLKPPLQPGVYVVRWHALAMDGHRTAGRYEFTVSR